jgi:RHS repeat-associated protein
MLTVRGVGGLPVAAIMPSSSSSATVWAYYHHDVTGGTVAATVPGTPGAATVFTYSEFGAPGAGGGLAYTYAGYRYDTETGLYYVNARYYNPNLGRFLQTDPIGLSGGTNLYAYVGNDPLDLVDPTGMSPDEMPQDTNAAPGNSTGGQSYSLALGGGVTVNGTFAPVYVDGSTGLSPTARGVTITADSNCTQCQWVQVVARTGADATTGLLDYSPLSETPFYPNQDNYKPGSFYDQPKNYFQTGNWVSSGGTFSAVSVLGIPNASNHTFTPIAAISWGYSVSAQGQLTMSPPTSTPGQISYAMQVMNQSMPSWSGN